MNITSLLFVLHRALFALTLAAGALAAQAQELIVNGSFEQPAMGTRPLYEYLPGGNRTMTGWETVLYGAERFDPGMYNVGAAQNGSLALDLNNDYGVGGGVMQLIATTPGQLYVLSLHAGTWAGAGRDGFGRITVVAGDTSRQFTVHSTDTRLVWQRFVMLFRATATTTAVTLLNLSYPSENFSLIDNVSVVASTK